MLDLKAELYSMVETAGFLQNRHEKGFAPSDFYYRILKTFHEELSQIQLEVIRKGKTLEQLTANMPISHNLQQIIREISAVADIRFNQLGRTLMIDPFQLASATMQVTCPNLLRS